MSKECITPDDSVGIHDRYETESSDKHLSLIPESIIENRKARRKSGHLSLHSFTFQIYLQVCVYCLQYDFMMVDPGFDPGGLICGLCTYQC